MIAGALLLSLAVCALPAGADARAEAAAQAPVTSENAELFLPAGYEQYLPLDAPTDAAFSDAYIAVADGKSLYVYDRLAGEYACYTHSYSISKIGFAGDGTLYFSDIEAYLYSFDAQTMTAERTGANSSTFCIEGDSLYYAIVTAQTTRIGRYDMDDFSAPAEDLATIEAVSGTPRMTVFEGALLCAAGPVVYCYAPGSPATTFQLSKNPAEVTGVSSLCAYNGTLYYTAAGGLYRTNTDSECTLLCEGSDFSALTVFQDSLYCVKGASVLQTEIEGDGVAFTGYEICASSASLNRLGSGNAAVRADDLLAVADGMNERIGIYRFSTGSYSAIDCGYAPALVATDGDLIAASDGTGIYVYSSAGELQFSASAEMPVTGLACLYGQVYFITQFLYGTATETGVKTVYHTGSSSLKGITGDIYGNLFVACADGSVTRYGREEFAQDGMRGEALAFTLPAGFTSLRADFEGNLYCLAQSTLYRNGTPFAEVDAEGLLYRSELPDPVSFALGFEDNAVYFLYDNFMIRTNALSFPVLSAIPYGAVRESLYAPQDSLTMLSVSASAVGIRTDLDELRETESDCFPYERYFRTEEAARGILLCETEEYYLVALFGADHKYTANLFKKQFCTPVDPDEYWQETDAVRYLTSDVSPCYFPCLISALRDTHLPRAQRVTLLGTVESRDTSDYPYALIRYETEDGTATGYVPLSYLTAAPPLPEAEQFRIAWLKADPDGVVFTADDGTQLTVTERTQVRISGEGEAVTALFERDGVTYRAQIAEGQLERSLSDAIRISLIVGLSVLAAIVIGCWIYLLPRRKHGNNA